MIDHCKEEYLKTLKRIKNNEHLYNTDKEKFFKEVIGFNESHCAWRYIDIHADVERMGGWANYRHYSNNNAATDYINHINQQRKIDQLQKQVDDANEQLKFYGDENNWDCQNNSYGRNLYIIDDGEAAREYCERWNI